MNRRKLYEFFSHATHSPGDTAVQNVLRLEGHNAKSLRAGADQCHYTKPSKLLTMMDVQKDDGSRLYHGLSKIIHGWGMGFRP